MRAMTQPVAIIATVPKPYSSAPMSAHWITSRPERQPPGAQDHALAKVILDERAVRLDEAHLHGTARVLDGGERGRGAAVAGDR